jgi:DNA adenine methylase
MRMRARSSNVGITKAHCSSITLSRRSTYDKPLTPPRPFLRWAGSKRKLLFRLRRFWKPEYRRYIEPFAGSACFFFDLMPPHAVLGDINESLMETYRVVREEPEGLFRRLTRLRRDADTYYRWRAKDPNLLDPQTRALRFVYLNRNCFNGIYRTSMVGKFNVPFGGKKGLPIGKLAKADLLGCAELLNRATLVTGDYRLTLAYARKGDFVYLDPPYATNSRRVFRQYGAKTFETGDVRVLADELVRLNRIGAEFLVSYADSKEARALAANWNAARLYVRRNIAGFVDHRRKAGEWLISNIALPELD